MIFAATTSYADLSLRSTRQELLYIRRVSRGASKGLWLDSEEEQSR